MENKRIDQYMVVAANLIGPCPYNRNSHQESEDAWMSRIKQLALKFMKEADQMSAIK